MKRAAALGLLVLAVSLPSGCSSAAGNRAPVPAISTSHRAAPPTRAPSTSPTSPTSPTSVPAPGPSWANASRVSVRKASWRLPGPLSRGVVFAEGSRILAAGGLTPGDRSSARVWSIDPGTGRATTQPDLPQPVHDAAGILLQGAPTLLGGGNTRQLNEVQRRDSAGRWRTIGRLPGTRSDLSAVAVPGGGLVIGGYDGQAGSPTVLQTSDGRRYREFARLTHGVRYAAVAQSGGMVWVIGGEDAGAQLPWIQRLDLQSGKASVVGRWPVRLGHAAAIAVGTRVLVLGGRTSAHRVTDAMWWFDPASGAITDAGRLPYPVADAGLVVTRDAAYLLGGEGPDFRRDVLEIRPVR